MGSFIQNVGVSKNYSWVQIVFLKKKQKNTPYYRTLKINIIDLVCLVL
jgi:hypothetical protein